MCFGGSGWNPLEDIKKLAADPVGTIASAIVNVSTGGLVGVKDGQLAPGVAVSAAKEGVLVQNLVLVWSVVGVYFL